VLLVSCYELGHQPLGIATPLAFLKRAGFSAETLDLSVEPFDEERVRRADVVAVSVPMHTALRLGLRVAERVRELNPDCHLSFHGLYATLNGETLRAAGADSILSGECEEALVDVVRKGTTGSPPPFVAKLDYPVPQRSTLPDLDRYVHLELPDGALHRVGTVETSRGCRHRCRHCPIPPVYEGRFFVVPQHTVLEDIACLVARGVRHINFADPDFLNGPGHALEIVRAMRGDFPELTFDFTAKVEHLLKRKDDLIELHASGCAFIVSAVESLSDRVLSELGKGHTAREACEALSLARGAGIALRPTFVAFTPWTTRDDYLAFLSWVVEEELIGHVDPIQLTLRLLIPPGSLLLNNESLHPHLGELDADALTYRWAHPDPHMDALQRDLEKIVGRGIAERKTHHEIFHAVAEHAGLQPVSNEDELSSLPGPRLTETWFC